MLKAYDIPVSNNFHTVLNDHLRAETKSKYI